MIQYVPTAPGGWLFVAAPNAVVLVASADKPDTPTQLSATQLSPAQLTVALDSAEPIAAVLDLLSSNGLAATPAFAVASWNAEGTVHLIVRGTPTVTLTTAPDTTTNTTPDEQSIDGSAVSTWRETTISAVTQIRLTVSAHSDAHLNATSDAVTAAELPLVAGAVWTTAATITPLSSPLPSPLTSPATAAATSAVPSSEGSTAAHQHNAADATVPEHTLAEHTLAEHTIVEIPEREPDSGPIPTSAVQPTPTAQPGVETTDQPAPQPAVETAAEPITEAESAPHTAAQDQPAADGYGHLFGETVVRTIESAAVRPPEEDEGESQEGADSESTSDPTAADPATTDPTTAGPSNPSSPTLTADPTSLGDLVAETPGASAQPVVRNLARGLRLELSTGGSESLSQPIRVGRAPSVTQLSNGLVPRLITIPDDKDISRNHVDVAVEGDTVVVTDLNSRNGTSVILPGKPPQTLRHGEPTAVLVDTVIDLGGGVTLTVKDSQ